MVRWIERRNMRTCNGNTTDPHHNTNIPINTTKGPCKAFGPTEAWANGFCVENHCLES